MEATETFCEYLRGVMERPYNRDLKMFAKWETCIHNDHCRIPLDNATRLYVNAVKSCYRKDMRGMVFSLAGMAANHGYLVGRFAPGKVDKLHSLTGVRRSR